MKRIILAVVFCAVTMISLFPPSVLSLKCIVCNSHKSNESDCNEASDEKLIEKYSQNCSEIDLHGRKINREEAAQGDENQTNGTMFEVCRKIVTWIDTDVNKNKATKFIVRKCGNITSEYDNSCSYRSPGGGTRNRVCSCTHDNCNSAFTVQVNYILMSITFFVATNAMTRF